MVFENMTPCSSVESVVHNFPDKPAGSRFGAMKAQSDLNGAFAMKFSEVSRNTKPMIDCYVIQKRYYNWRFYRPLNEMRVV